MERGISKLFLYCHCHYHYCWSFCNCWLLFLLLFPSAAVFFCSWLLLFLPHPALPLILPITITIVSLMLLSLLLIVVLDLPHFSTFELLIVVCYYPITHAIIITTVAITPSTPPDMCLCFSPLCCCPSADDCCLPLPLPLLLLHLSLLLIVICWSQHFYCWCPSC